MELGWGTLRLTGKSPDPWTEKVLRGSLRSNVRRHVSTGLFVHLSNVSSHQGFAIGGSVSGPPE